MASATAPQVVIPLDKPRTIRLDLNTFATVEEITGLNLMNREEWGKLSLSTVRAFLYATFRQEDPDLTLEDVGALIHLGNITEVMEAFKSGLEAALPKPKAEGKKRPLAASKQPE